MSDLDSVEDHSESIRDLGQQARRLARSVPADLREVVLTCPLCGGEIPVRGLRARPMRGVDQGQWQIIFVCPACGLITAFDADKTTPTMAGIAREADNEDWLNGLRTFRTAPRSVLPAHAHASGIREFVTAFLICFLTWMLLIGNFNPLEVTWGLVASVLCARFTYRFSAIGLPGRIFRPDRLLALVGLISEFVRQLIAQNISLSLRVLNPRLKVRPGIIAIPTKLKGDIPLTLLGSLSTLTPDTVVVDIDQQRGLVYVHWIDVKTIDPEKAYQLISASLEEKISRWLEEDRKS